METLDKPFWILDSARKKPKPLPLSYVGGHRVTVTEEKEKKFSYIFAQFTLTFYDCCAN